MNIALWVLQALLAAFFLAAGAFHVLMPIPRLKASAPWTEDVGGPMARRIGVVEVFAAIGLVVPGITHVATLLAPLAAIGVVLMFLGAIALHRSSRAICVSGFPPRTRCGVLRDGQLDIHAGGVVTGEVAEQLIVAWRQLEGDPAHRARAKARPGATCTRV
jgi:uncharacterized membrane protein YphA (DoxX/SURF4 family)